MNNALYLGILNIGLPQNSTIGLTKTVTWMITWGTCTPYEMEETCQNQEGVTCTADKLRRHTVSQYTQFDFMALKIKEYLHRVAPRKIQHSLGPPRRSQRCTNLQLWPSAKLPRNRLLMHCPSESLGTPKPQRSLSLLLNLRTRNQGLRLQPHRDQGGTPQKIAKSGLQLK